MDAGRSTGPQPGAFVQQCVNTIPPSAIASRLGVCRKPATVWPTSPEVIRFFQEGSATSLILKRQRSKHPYRVGIREK